MKIYNMTVEAQRDEEMKFLERIIKNKFMGFVWFKKQLSERLEYLQKQRSEIE